MHVLVVDDNAGVREALQLLFELHELDVVAVADPAEARRVVARGETGVVVQDMNFRPSATSGEEGVALFRDLRALDADLPVILLTAWTDLETAVALVREGADDYLGKPWDDRRLVETVRGLLRARALRQARVSVADCDLAGLVYASAEMHAVVSLALRVAPAEVPVLITGPSGSGKERIASLIRANSRRRDRPFVTVNAGALPADLVESELFGAERGAYTGSDRAREGMFEAADGGTLFLDEIGTLPPAGQAALLRAVQSGEIHRLGSTRSRTVDVRVIAATNVDLVSAMAAGRFREDLYYRLAVIELHVPALVDRPEDVEPLAEAFLAELGIDPEAALDGTVRRALRLHHWPGNVRELQNRLRRAAVVRTGVRISPSDLGFGSVADPRIGDGPDERRELEAALADADGRVSRAAELLGLTRQALYRRMERLGLRVERRVLR